MASGDKTPAVVEIHPQMTVANGGHAARILELGLTAYGATPQEAQQKVMRMFTAAAHVHGELGTLEEWLNRSGLKWRWDKTPIKE